jgi:phytoene synthase
MAAGRIYAAIGTQVQKAGFDNITQRAHTTKGRKIWLMAGSTLSAATFSMLPVSPRVHARPEPEVAYLVDAAARRNLHPQRSEVLISALMALKARDRGLARERGLAVD